MTATVRTWVTAMLVAVGAVLALIVAPSAQAVTTVTPLSPASGQSIQVTPPPGFANADYPFRWSISYDCPGPDATGLKVSNVQTRRLGETEFATRNVAAPFLGSGTFTNPVSFSPEPTPIVYEWRVRWDCGGYGTFPGAQGFSEVVTFTLLPLSGPAPQPQPQPQPQPAPAPTPAPTPTPTATPAAGVKRASHCAGLRGKQRTRCLAMQRRKSQVKACAKLRGARKTRCVARASTAYRRAIGATR